SVSGYQDLVVLDLSDEDTSLLVACCCRSVEAIDGRLVDGVVPPGERQWLVKKRQLLSDWAVEMAAKPLTVLPLPRLSPATSEAVRALNTRIQDKVYGDVSKRQKFGAPQTGESAGHSSLAQGIATFGETLARTSLNDTALPMPGPVSHQNPPPATVAMNTAMPPLLDRNKVRDPRLRSLISVDMNAFDRCQQDADYRLSTVLLASILESALLDHAIPRRAELGLSGTPDMWNVQDVLLRAMGDAAQPKDRALSFHLFASRNLLRPALQMMVPAVVTAASFEGLHAFASRAVYALGFGAPSQTLPPGAICVDDQPI
ncbi:MAG: hypothetical protein ACI91B_003167, partial [Planctomycetota bacterium]